MRRSSSATFSDKIFYKNLCLTSKIWCVSEMARSLNELVTLACRLGYTTTTTTTTATTKKQGACAARSTHPFGILFYTWVTIRYSQSGKTCQRCAEHALNFNCRFLFFIHSVVFFYRLAPLSEFLQLRDAHNDISASLKMLTTIVFYAILYCCLTAPLLPTSTLPSCHFTIL